MTTTDTQADTQADTSTETALEVANKERDLATRKYAVVHDDGPLSYLFDTARFEHMSRIATAMANASLIPDHMRGNKSGPFDGKTIMANCFLVVNQSLRWGMDPFAVVPETYVVGGKLSYQGKLVAAVVNARADLIGRLKYTFTGTRGKDDRTITVTGHFRGEPEPVTIELSVGDAKTDNTMWRKDPDQKLVYSGVVKWARRYCPEIVLGVLTDDDAERMALEAPATEQTADSKVAKPNFSRSKPSQPEASVEVESEVQTTERTEKRAESTPADEPKSQKASEEPMGAGEQLEIAVTDAGVRGSTALAVLRQYFGGEVPRNCKTLRELPQGIANKALRDIDALIQDAQAYIPPKA